MLICLKLLFYSANYFVFWSCSLSIAKLSMFLCEDSFKNISISGTIFVSHVDMKWFNDNSLGNSIFVTPCSSLLVLHVPTPRQRTFALVSYPPPSRKKFCDVYEFSNEKSGSEKKKIFFCKLNIKDQYFLHSYTVIYIMTIKIFTNS